MDRNVKLIKNTIIYFIGTFASKVLTFILLPIYTIYLQADDFGQVDLMLVTTSLIVPIFTVQTVDAAYRYMLDAKTAEEQDSIVSNSCFIYAVGMLCFTALYVPFVFIFHVQYGIFFLFYVISVYFFQLIQQLARGMKHNAVYAASGVLMTLLQGGMNILLIVGLSVGSSSLITAPIFASVCGIFYINHKIHFFGHLKKELVCKEKLAELLKYSFPLCLHSLCWGVMISCGTYFLTYFTGSTEGSGIVGMANKFPQLLIMINSIFFLAWQENAVEQYEAEDRNVYYSKMYNTFLTMQLTIVAVLLPMIKIYFTLFQQSDFVQAWTYIPFLFVNSIMSSAISFVSTGYTIAKKTKGVFKSTLAGALVSIAVSFVLIRKIYIYGVVIGMFAGYLVILILRAIDTRKYMSLELEWKKQIMAAAFMLLSAAAYYCLGFRMQFAVWVFIAAGALLLNRELVKKISGMAWKLLRSRSNRKG